MCLEVSRGSLSFSCLTYTGSIYIFVNLSFHSLTQRDLDNLISSPFWNVDRKSSWLMSPLFIPHTNPFSHPSPDFFFFYSYTYLVSNFPPHLFCILSCGPLGKFTPCLSDLRSPPLLSVVSLTLSVVLLQGPNPVLPCG